MSNIEVKKIIKPILASDGAGVKLKRSIGVEPNYFDPFLMLDEFGSENSEDYIAGFPPHPHRGIETVTYMLQGEFEHEDSTGAKGRMSSGDVQWMKTGSGIIHSEMPAMSEGRLHGFQLWINMPAKLKMSKPNYIYIDSDKMSVHKDNDKQIKIIAGKFEKAEGPVKDHNVEPVYFDVELKKDKEFKFNLPSSHNSFIYLINGEIEIGNKKHDKTKDSTLILLEKGEDLNSRLDRNFGMMKPEGYRKCIRLMKLADRFKIPVISFIDTPGAYPGIGAEQRGQAGAIASSIECCMSLKVPNISIIIGEGGSGGAIALASSNKVIMLENSIYSVISPEGCASILWRDPSKSLQAAEAMKMTAKDLLKLKIIDEIIPEPLGGAHRDPNAIAQDIKHNIIKNLRNFENLSREQVYDHRKTKFLQIGRDQGFVKSSHTNDASLSYKETVYQKFISHLVKNKILYFGLGIVIIAGLVSIIY